MNFYESSDNLNFIIYLEPNTKWTNSTFERDLKSFLANRGFVPNLARLSSSNENGTKKTEYRLSINSKYTVYDLERDISEVANMNGFQANLVSKELGALVFKIFPVIAKYVVGGVNKLGSLNG